MDPYFNRQGQTYYFRPDCTGYDNCTQSNAPINAAIDNTVSQGLPDGGTIYVEGGHFSETVNISSLPGALTFKGRADGENTYLDGSLIVNGNNAPLSFLYFIFNGDVSLQNAKQVTFQDSTFNGSFSAAQTSNLALNNNTSHAAATGITSSDDLTIDSSRFDAGVILNSLNQFTIHQSGFQGGMIIEKSQNGLISDSTFDSGVTINASDVEFISTPANNDAVDMTLGSEKGQVTVKSRAGSMASLKVTGQTGSQDMNLHGGEILFGEGKVLFDPQALRMLDINLVGGQPAAVIVDSPLMLAGSLNVDASRIIVKDSIQAKAVTLNGQGDVQIQGNILSENAINILSGTTLDVDGRVQSDRGDVTFCANNGIQVNPGAHVMAAGQVTMDADHDRDGLGTYTQQAGAVVEGQGGVSIRAADVVLLGSLLAGGALVQLIPSQPGQIVTMGDDMVTGFNLSLDELKNIHTSGALIIGDQSSRGDINIGSLDLSSMGIGSLNVFGGNMNIDQLSLAFAGLLQLLAAGYITSRSQGKTNISIPGGSLVVNAMGFGTSAAPIRTAVDIFSALVNCIGSIFVSDLNTIDMPGEAIGGIYLRNDGDLTLAGQDGIPGLTSGGEIIIFAPGTIRILAPVVAKTLVNLNAFAFDQLSIIRADTVLLTILPDPYMIINFAHVPYPSIASAILDFRNPLVVTDDNTIYIEAGSYGENLDLSNITGLTIQAEGGIVRLTGSVDLSSSNGIKFIGINITGTITLNNTSGAVITGSAVDDTFTLALSGANAFIIHGGGGNDTVEIKSGTVDQDLLISLNDIKYLTIDPGALFDVADFFQVTAGTMSIQYQSAYEGKLTLSGNSIAPPTDTNAWLISTSAVDAFIGMAGGTSNKAGFSITSLSFALALYKETGGLGRKWFSLKTSGGTISLDGIANLTITGGDLTVVINQEASDHSVVDYSGSNKLTLESVDLDMDGAAGQQILAAGNGTLHVFGLFDLSGSFAIQKKAAQPLYISNKDSTVLGNDLVSANLLSIGLKNMVSFIGYSGIGLNLTGLNLAVAIWSEVGTARKWVSVMANADTIAFAGLEDLGLTMDISNGGFTINQADADGTLADYKKGDGETDATVTTLSVKVGPGAKQNMVFTLDDADGPSFLVTGTVTVHVFGLFDLSGSFAIQKKAAQPLYISNKDSTVLGNDLVSANLLSIGLKNMVSFIGYSGIGLNLTGLNLAVAIWSEVGTARKWVSVMANADTIAFAGLEDLGLTMDISNGGFTINQADADGTLADYKKGDGETDATVTTLSVKVGPGAKQNMVFTLDDADGPSFLVTGTVDIDLFGLVNLKGSFSVQKQSGKTISLAKGAVTSATTANLLLFSFFNITAFLGFDKVGLNLSGINLAIALWSEVSGTRQWSSVMASVSGAGFSGFSVLKVINPSLSIAINRADADGTVVDYRSGKTVLNATVGASSTVPFTMDGSLGPLLEVEGSATLSILGFVDLTGDFVFEKPLDNSQKILVGATGISLFLGCDAIGFQVTNGSLGLVLFANGTYTLVASGTTALVGLTGLISTSTVGLQINNTGLALNQTVHTKTGSVIVNFATADNVEQFTGTLNLVVANIFTLTGTIAATILTNGIALINVPDAKLDIKIDGTDIFSISAAIRFSISKADGFSMDNFLIKGFTFMGTGANASTKPDDLLTKFANSLPGAPPVKNNTAAPDATLIFPIKSDQVDIATLNSRQYIDVLYNDYSTKGIDSSTINGDEFTLGGAGKGTAALVGTATPVTGKMGVYRYAFTGSFIAGDVDVNFVVGTWADTTLTTNQSATQTFTVVDGSSTATKTIKFGQLSLSNPSIIIQDFKFYLYKNPDNSITPRVSIMIGLGLGEASMSIGDTKVDLQQLKGLFELALDLDPFKLTATGKFTITVGSLSVKIPNILEVTGTNIDINYDPNGLDSQEFLRTSDLSMTIFPLNNLTAKVTDLVIRGDGFSIGSASLSGNVDIGSGSSKILSLTAFTFGVTNVNVYTDGRPSPFSGTIFITADAATLFPDSTKFNFSITDGPDAGTVALSMVLTFKDGMPNGFTFNADQFSFALGTYLTVNGSNIAINSNAAANEEVVSFDSLGVKIHAGSLQVSGSLKAFGFLGDGSFETKSGFGVFVDTSALTGSSVGWPSWIPVKVTAFGITWPDINLHPEGFVLTLSASVTGLYNLPFDFSGSIDGVVIDMNLLEAGKFPIQDIGSIAVSIDGDLFGGHINGELLGGILKIKDGAEIPATDTTTVPDDRIFFMGVAGGFEMAGLKFGIQFALSELGPLNVMISASTPTGVLLDPTSGLTINNFVFGVNFFSSLPSYVNPSDLINIQTITGTMDPPAKWLAKVHLQVIAQYTAIKNNPNQAGFLAAFTSPMIIYGKATLYSEYTSQDVFNGDVQIQVSTDGKFFIYGKLSFAKGAISLGARLYADLSNVASGSVNVLFLSDIPEQAHLLVISGKFQMGFKDATGKPVVFDTVDPVANPYADLVSPTNGNTASLNGLNSLQYIDVAFFPSTGANLDTTTINGDEFTLGGAGRGTAALVGTATPVTGKMGVYRYAFTGSFIAGEVDVNFAAGSWADDAQKTNLAASESFTTMTPTAVLVGPKDGNSINLTDINGHQTITVRFIVADDTILDIDTITGDEITLSEPGVSGLTACSPVPVKDLANTYTYTISGGAFLTGQVTVNIVPGKFQDKSGTANLAVTQSFAIYGVTMALSDPISGGSVDVAALNARGYLDVSFIPLGNNTIISGSLIDGNEFTLEGKAVNNVQLVSGAPALLDAATNTYRYAFTGSFTPGTLVLKFAPASWQDSGGNTNIAETRSFTVNGATAVLSGGFERPVVGLSIINNEKYIEVTFNPTSGSQLDSATILDAGAEFTLSGDGAKSITAIGAPVLVAGTTGTYRYAVTGTFSDGVVNVNFIPGSFADTAHYSNLGGPATFTLASPTAALYAPAYQDTIDYNRLNQMGYLFVTFKDPTGVGIDPNTLNASDITLTGDGAAGVNLMGTPTLANKLDQTILDNAGLTAASIPDNVYAFQFTNPFTQGGVVVTFKAGGFATKAGATNETINQGFNVIGQATDFEILLAGSVALYIPELDQELFAIEGQVDINIDISNARLMLDSSGSMRVIYLGTIATTAAQFVLAFHKNSDDSITPQFWGVATLEIGPSKLIQFGFDLDVFAQLNVNTTSDTHIETLSLPVLLSTYSDAIAKDLNDYAAHPVASLPASLQNLINQMSNAHLPLNALGSIFVTVVAAGWQITDGTNIYTLEKTVNNIAQTNLSVIQEKPFKLAPNLFSLQMAGKLRVGEPDKDKTTIDTEYFRLSGTFDMEISSTGFQMFVDADLTIGPPTMTLLNQTAVGLIIVNKDGLAINLELTSAISLGSLFNTSVSFFLILNTTSRDEQYAVPALFLTNKYLSQNFQDTYIQDGLGAVIGTPQVASQAVKDALNQKTLPDSMRQAINDNDKSKLGTNTVTIKVIYKDSWWEVSDGHGNDYVVRLNDSGTLDIHESLGHTYMVIPGGPPQLDATPVMPCTLGTPQFYFIVQGQGKITIANTLYLDGFFRMEISASSFTLQVQAAYEVKIGTVTLFSGSALGDLQISGTKPDLVGYLELTQAVGLPSSAGFGLQGRFSFEINTTAQDQTISRYVHDADGNLVANTSGGGFKMESYLIPALSARVFVSGKLALGSVFEVDGSVTFTLNTAGFTIQIDGNVQLGGFSQISVKGIAGIYVEGNVPVFACSISVTINLGIPLVDISGSGLFNVNTSLGTSYLDIAPASF